jgi:K+-transporting ATPase KdpF subunit
MTIGLMVAGVLVLFLALYLLYSIIEAEKL